MEPSDQNVQSFTDAWATNIKALFDQHLADVQRAQESSKTAEATILRHVDDYHALAVQMMQNAVTTANVVNNATATEVARGQSAAAAWQNLVLAGALTNPAELAETAIGAKVTEQVRDAVSRAFDTVTAASAQASPLPQGTTGVAQGSMQTTNAVAADAIMAQLAATTMAMQAQMAKLAEVVNVLLVRVVGEEVKPLTTPAAA